MLYIAIFVIFYIYCVSLCNKPYTKQDKVLKIGTVVIAVLIGFRKGWPDEEAYLFAFNGAPYLNEFSWDTQSLAYAELGYFYLTSVIKTIYFNSTFYFLVMGGLSMYLLYKCLDKYCLLPLIGFCDYIARFLLNRDFTQMRSSLAILLIVIATKYIYEKKMWKYMLVVLLAYQFHHSALLAIPLYFICMLNLKHWHIVTGILIAFPLATVFAPSISVLLSDWSRDLEIQTYTEGEYVEQALGFANPMIYFQIAVLLLFTFREKQLTRLTPYYNIFRTGYFYSTLFLIFFCNYTALSGRTSTIFATFEMFVLSALTLTFSGVQRKIYFTSLIVILSYFFYSKFWAAMMMTNGAAGFF